VANQQFAGLLERAIAYHHTRTATARARSAELGPNAGWQTRSTETLGRLRAEPPRPTERTTAT
jgi:hypothetical protein